MLPCLEYLPCVNVCNVLLPSKLALELCQAGLILHTSVPTTQYPVFRVAVSYLLDSDGAKPFEAAVPFLRRLQQQSFSPSNPLYPLSFKDW
jgi:hypothetical protein